MTTNNIVKIRKPQTRLKRKTLEVADQRFLLKEWFTGGAQSRGLRKPRLWSLLFKVFRLKGTQICPPIAQKGRGQLYVEVSEVYFYIYSLFTSTKLIFPYKIYK